MEACFHPDRGSGTLFCEGLGRADVCVCVF